VLSTPAAMSDVCCGSWLRENAEIEFANGNFVSTSINLKNKSAGDDCRDKTIEKTILRAFRARTFSRSQGQKLTWACSDGSSVFSPTTDIETASDGRAETDDERQVASRESS
jgi:hypothetical protein